MSRSFAASRHEIASTVLQTEADAVRAAIDQLDSGFDRAVEIVQACKGMVVVSGMGKSGIVGQKISATLSSIGTPSHFLHPSEAMHGDLGRIRREDVVLLLSNGGQTDEVLSLAALLRQDDVAIISMTGRRDSHLARLSDAHICIGSITEACPHHLAPTTSTTVMLAMGDALALTVSQMQSFSLDDYRKRHPGGLLGRQMMMLADVMRFRTGTNLPLIHESRTVAEVLAEAATAPRRSGAVLLVDDEDHLTGIFTDADLRRLIVREGIEVMQRPVREIMTAQPRTLRHTDRVRDAVQLMREIRVDEIPILDEANRPVGLIDVQDLMALKVIDEPV